MNALRRRLTRREWLTAYAIAVAGSTTVGVLTVLLVESGLAVESNPATAAFVSSTSWSAAIAAKLMLVAGSFALYRSFARRGYHTCARAGVWLLAGLIALNAANDLFIFYSVGVPSTSTLSLESTAVISLALVVALIVATRDPQATIRRALELATSSTPSAQTVGAVTFAILLVTSPIAPAISIGTASSQVATTTFSDDFEDGSSDGWDAGTVVNESTNGDHSLQIDGGSAYYTDGPELNTSGEFLITGTHRAKSGSSDGQTVLAVQNQASGEFLRIQQQYGYNRIQISTSSAAATYDRRSGAGVGTWQNFKIYVSDGFFYAKMWAVGNSEPNRWTFIQKLSQNFTGQFKFKNDDMSTADDDVSQLDDVSINTEPSISAPHESLNMGDWNRDFNPGDPVIEQLGTSDDYSLALGGVKGDGDNEHLMYEPSPEIDTDADSYRVTGRYHVNYQQDSGALWGGPGIINQSSENSSILASRLEYNRRVLKTPTAGFTGYYGHSLGGNRANNWMEFEIVYDNGTMFAKSWQTGQSKPSDWNLVSKTHMSGLFGFEVNDNVIISVENTSVSRISDNFPPNTENKFSLSEWEWGNGNPLISTSSTSNFALATNNGELVTKPSMTYNTGESFTLNWTVRRISAGDDNVRVGIRNGSGGFIEVVTRGGYGRVDLYTNEQWRSTLTSNEFGTNPYNVKLKVTPGEVYAKAWAVGSSEPADWQGNANSSIFTGYPYVDSQPGARLSKASFFRPVGGSGGDISGHVTDQNGEPCANCTVEIVGVDHSQLSGSVEDKHNQATELLEETSNPFPDSWNPDLSITGSDGLAQSAGDNYVAVHTPEDWAVHGWVDTVELDNPIIRAPAEEQIALSVWNPSAEGGTLTIENTVDDDLYGATTERNVVVERLDPLGDVVDRQVYEPNSHTTTGVSINSIDHHFVATSLPAGVYRVYPEGAESTAYPILVGNEDDLRSTYRTDLENQAGELTQAAKAIQDRFNEGKLTRTTVETNATGHYSADIPSNTKTVGVSAYSVDGEILNTFENPTPQDMRSWIKNNQYNGSVYFSLEPQMYNVPHGDADVGVRKFSSPPYQLLDEWSSKWGNFRDRLENMTRTELGSIYSVPLDEWNRTELEDGAQNLSKIIDSNNEELINEWEERSGENWDEFMNELESGDRANEELQSDIRDMEETIAELREQMSSEPPDVGVGGGDGDSPGLVTFQQIYDGDFSKDDVVATWYDNSGSTKPIPSEYISVNKRAMRGDQVVVNDFPIPDGSTGGSVGVLVVSEDGNLGSGRESVKNPAFDGDVPSIASIDVSTLRPGPSERVTLEPRVATAGVTFDSIEVFDGTGSTVDASIENGKARFTPGSMQTHMVRLTFTGADGNEFVETVRVPVGESSMDYPESVAVKEGRLGVFALAGDEVDAANVEINDAGSTIDITALVKPDQGTNEIHYYLEQAPSTSSQSITVRVVQGNAIDTATSVQRHVGVYIHGRELADGAIVYRNGAGVDQTRYPIPADSETRGGERKPGENGGTIIHSYTSGNGAATVDVNNNPGTIDQLRYRVDVWVNNFEIPFTVVSIPIAPLDDVVIAADDTVALVVDVASSSATSGVDELTALAHTTPGVVSSGGAGDVLVDVVDATIGGAHETISPVTGVTA